MVPVSPTLDLIQREVNINVAKSFCPHQPFTSSSIKEKDSEQGSDDSFNDDLGVGEKTGGDGMGVDVGTELSLLSSLNETQADGNDMLVSSEPVGAGHRLESEQEIVGVDRVGGGVCHVQVNC